MVDFREIKKGYFKGKLDGIRAERLRTGVFFENALREDFENLHSLLANHQQEEEKLKMLGAQLKQLKRKMANYRQTIMADDVGESLRHFAKRMNALHFEEADTSFKIYVEGEESIRHKSVLPAIKHLISRIVLDYKASEDAKHDLSLILGHDGCKLIFVYPKAFEKNYPLFRKRMLDMASMAGLTDEASSHWQKYVLWQLSF